MTTNATATTDNKNKIKEALETAEKLAETGIDIAVLKKKVQDAVEDAVIDAQRMAKHGRHALEDVVDDTVHYIKKNPLQSVGYAVGAGFGAGLVVALFMRRPRANNSH